jgi:hypothetical protein
LHRPRGDPAVRAGQSPGRQRLPDQRTDARFVVRGEQQPKPHGAVTGWHRVGVVRRQWAWRLMVPMSAQRNGYRATGRIRVAAGVQRDHGVVGIRGAGHRQPPGATVTVSVTVLVLMLVLMLVVGSVVVVVVVMGGSVVVAVTVSVTVRGGDVGVIGVSVAGLSSADGPEMRLANPHTISATSTAPSAPNATSAAGLRYQAVLPEAGRAAGRRSGRCRNSPGCREVRSAPRAPIVGAQGGG